MLGIFHIVFFSVFFWGGFEELTKSITKWKKQQSRDEPNLGMFINAWHFVS